MHTAHISKLNLLKQPSNRLGIDPSELMLAERAGNPTGASTGTRATVSAAANAAEENPFGSLIPIKLDIEIEGQRLKEQFLWDKNEPYLSLEAFAKLLIEEQNLSQAFEADIVS